MKIKQRVSRKPNRVGKRSKIKIMKTITFQLPDLGKAVGTVAWVATELEKITSSIKLSKTKDGMPCLTYQSLTDKNTNGEYKRYVLCFTGSDKLYYKVIEGNSVLYAVDGEYNHGLFPYLTPAAKIYVDKFLEEILENFISELEKN